MPYDRSRRDRKDGPGNGRFGRSPGRGGQQRRTDREDQPPRRGTITVSPGGRLPGWVRDEIVRSTPKDRREAALSCLEQGLAAFSEDKHRQAVKALREAKDLAPRAATIRELLGLSLYQTESWEEALRELRTFRRLTGDTTHLAVEMDCLRALERDDGVHKTWQVFEERGGSRAAEDEARVVYASFLLDRGELANAWRIIKPGRLVADPAEGTLRRWAVAARVAAASGDLGTARKLVAAIREKEPDLPWLEDLEHLVE